MNREHIYLAVHDHMVEVPHLGGSHVVYEFSPQELLNKVQSLLEAERERCAKVCDEISDSWRGNYQPVKSMAADDIADIIRRLK
jgi:hypothetical protein